MHQVSSEWYTPGYIWNRVYKTFSTDKVYDPCPILGKNGLVLDWKHEFIYCNPPSPCYDFAVKTLNTFNFRVSKNLHTSIIYAAFSESILFQYPELYINHTLCMVRKRIRWIDSSTLVESDKPRNYNAFILLTTRSTIRNQFAINFGDIGKILTVKEL